MAEQRAYFVGLDLGQAQDYSALAVVEQSDKGTQKGYAVRHLQRWQLGTGYPKIVAETIQLIRKLPQQVGVHLCVDATGVGRAVMDLLRMAKTPEGDPFSQSGVKIIPITITAGFAVSKVADGWHVAKKDLVGVMQVLLGTRRFQIASSLDNAKTLAKELSAFRVKVNTVTGNETFEAWRERDHDDLVLAVALPCWYAMKKYHHPAVGGFRILRPRSDNKNKVRVLALSREQLAAYQDDERKSVMVVFCDPAKGVVCSDSGPNSATSGKERERNGTGRTDVDAGVVEADNLSPRGGVGEITPSQPPPHSLTLLDAPLFVAVADLDPAEAQDRWNELDPEYGRLPVELIAKPEDGKAFWRHLLKKRIEHPNQFVFVDDGNGDRRAEAASKAFCDMMGLPRTAIWNGDEEAKHDGKPALEHLWSIIKASRSSVI